VAWSERKKGGVGKAGGDGGCPFKGALWGGSGRGGLGGEGTMWHRRTRGLALTGGRRPGWQWPEADGHGPAAQHGVKQGRGWVVDEWAGVHCARFEPGQPSQKSFNEIEFKFQTRSNFL
jgi:hypothetical protein